MKLVCKDLQFSYSSERLIHVSQLEIQEASGIHWIRGASGAGKSTFLSLLAGLRTPLNGQILWNNFNLASASAADKNEFRFSHISFVHQENMMVDHWTVQQNFDLVSNHHELQNECLEAFKFKSTILKKHIHELSGGERQRLNLIQALIKNPKIALLDEPTSHLDNKNTEIALNLIESKLNHSTVIIISHDNRLEQRKFKAIDFEKMNS